MRAYAGTLALVSAVACSSCRHATEEHEEPIPVEVHCVPAARQSIDVTETLRGRLAAPPGGDLPVASQVAGRVSEVMVHEGDRVAAGTVVAAVEDSVSRDALRQANAALVQATAAAANADATLERTRQLVTRGIAAKQELDDAIARADQAHAGVAAATAASDVSRWTLGRVRVRSTFDGVVTRVWRGAGALVDGTAATPIIQLAATTLAEFDVDATERQLAGIESGQGASVVLVTGGDPIEGVVRARSTALDPATGLGFVRIALDAKTPMTLGAFGTATLKLGKRDGVLVVPTAAMRGAVADGAEVVVCARAGAGESAEGGADHGTGLKAEVRTVKVGWRDDARLEIVDGLAEGERVATDHVLGLDTDAPIAEAK
jgi:RND family efflux transporter MFP subunit